MLPVNEIICGAMPEATKVFPDGYFNCSISSPPYWALRDYSACDCNIRRSAEDSSSTLAGGGNVQLNRGKPDPNCPKCGGTGKNIEVEKKQLGLEPTFEEYIDKLCTIYDEVKRVLRDDGTCWVNLGDTYHNATKWTYTDGAQTISGGNPRNLKTGRGDNQGLPEKCLCLIPQRFAIEMVNRGWILRNVIIWHKPNPMPSSAKDRFTVDFEYVYFFVKSKKYWFEPQYEPHITVDDNRPGRTIYAPENKDVCGSGKGRLNQYNNPLGRNKRTVWTIPTQPFPEAHFATFPEKLVEPMIKAGCPEFVCTKCGKGREKIYEIIRDSETHSNNTAFKDDGSSRNFDGMRWKSHPEFKGYTNCGCNAEYRPGIMLEPFCGSGTALQVAAKLRRDWIGIELKQEYIEMAEKRATQGETGISVREQKQGQIPLFPVKET